jgi:uracil-DNA glycosylase
MEVKIEESWKNALSGEFIQPYFAEIKRKILAEKAKGKRIFPPGNLIFNAFQLTPLWKVKVVILGQDPYHGFGQAHGLCFSVPHGIEPPPSLKNIFKELESDIGFKIPAHGNLEKWAKQGVLLLNASLTVNEGEANSHAGFGWQNFTDAVIKTVSDKCAGVVFLLWGKFAAQKEKLIDGAKHFVLKAGHPSPLSANLFLGCKHFSKTNEILIRIGKTPIDWQL